MNDGYAALKSGSLNRVVVSEREFLARIMAMAATRNDEIKTLTTHYIDGAFVESHGREVIDTVKPTNGKVIALVTLADEEDTRRAIDAAKRAIVNACAPSLSATRPIPKSLSDRLCRRSRTSVCSPASVRALKKAPRCWSVARATRKGSKRATS